MGPPLHRVRDDLAEQRSELEGVPAAAARDDESLPVGVVIDEEVAVEGVAVEADAVLDERGVRQGGERVAQERARLVHVLARHLSAR